MNIINSQRFNPNVVLIIMIGLGYMAGVLNTFHRYPSTHDMYPDLVTIMFVAIGLIYWYAVSYVKQISLATIAWTIIFGLIVVQPYISHIVYPDSLIFDFSVLLTCIALSLCLANMANKTRVFQILVWFIVSAGILTVVTQISQYLKLDLPMYLLYPNLTPSRIYANVGQPNQAAFILALSTACLLYLSSLYQNSNKSLLLLLPSFLFAVGLGLSASRTGIILMAIAVLGYILLFRLPMRPKIITTGVCTTLLLLGYSLGSQLLLNYDSAATSGVARISSGALDLRWSQLQQAWLLFLDHPIIGVGWGNLMGASLDYAQQITWFSATAHSHFFISNIAAETGIIGLAVLLPFAYILIKNFSFKLSNFQAAVYTLLAIFIAYSCSEFPLWIPRYLVLFVVLFSLIDHSSFVVSAKMKNVAKYGLLGFSITLMLGSIYYQVQYRIYSKVHYAVIEPSFSYTEKEKRLSALSPVYGFEKFYDIFLFNMMSEDVNNIEYKVELTDKVLSHTLSYYVMVKAANMNLLVGNKKRALDLYKNACVFQYAEHCKQLEEDLHSSATVEGNDNMQWISTQFQQWRQENPERTGLDTSSDAL